jgi:UDP-N-acetylglucosamine--N-acetylmuramyl-(pentapeptide) pyrophosphoryl-undecaprenol N-acetylglucosamine transferase
MKIIISGGGTGGHIFPAIAIADSVKKIDPNADILFVGAEGKMEMERVPQAGYPIIGLPIMGFQRKLTFKNLAFPFKLVKSMWKARTIIKNFQPDIVVGVGGYASGPILEAAMRQGVPGLVQEQNSYAGVTNKILAKKVQKICVAYDNMDKFFPSEKIILTGNPVRNDIGKVHEIQRADAIAHFNFDASKKTIVVTGGSLGAKTLNIALREATALLETQLHSVQILWQCGKLYIDEYRQCATALLPNVKIVPFVDNMNYAYAMADVVISRAGALSISELCLVGKPTILLPSPNVAEDHQTQNALSLVRKDAAILIRDTEATEKMVQTALDLLTDAARSQNLSKNILTLGKPNAATEIAEEIFKIIN